MKELKKQALREQKPHWVPRQSRVQCAERHCLFAMRSLFVGLQDVHSRNGMTGNPAGYSRTPLALDNYRRLNLSDAWIKNAKK